MGVVEVCPLIEVDLESFLFELNPALTKATVKKRFKKFYKVEKTLKSRVPYSLPLELVNYSRVNPHFTNSVEKKINNKSLIIYEDQNWIAINKPACIHSHPLDYICSQNALSYLASQKKYDALKVNLVNYDRGLLFRLDYETSGVLIFAKSDKLYCDVRDQFSKVVKSKIYLARVSGDAREIIGHHTHHMKPFGKHGEQMIEGADRKARLAQLDVLEVQYDSSHDRSLVKVQLHTGIRHQIRFQLSILGFPIQGDSVYGGAQADRMYLHALEYKIKTVNHELCLNTGYPDDF